METVFSKIIKGEIPAYKVYETDHVLAFLDITQVTKGHTLLIPKTPVKDVFEWTPEIAKDMGQAIPLIANALQKAFPDMKGLNILNNNKAMAYQSVFHSHVHFLPRYEEVEGFGLKFESHQGDYSSQDMAEIANKIQESFE